jgi:DNA-binding transcriptional regulator YbjK
MDDRRRLLADSALAVIGEGGIRALTHHAVDDRAGLARGSTSYYCRRRVDLLRLSLERLYLLDEADLRAAVERAQGASRAGVAGSTTDSDEPRAVSIAVAELIASWLTGEGRARSIARIELFMAASHEPELQPLLAEQLAGMRAAGLPLAQGTGTEGVRRLAAGFMLADGLMLGVLREGRPAPSAAEIAALLAVLN